MPRRKQSKRFEALHRARWAGSSSAATYTSSTVSSEDISSSSEASYITE